MKKEEPVHEEHEKKDDTVPKAPVKKQEPSHKKAEKIENKEEPVRELKTKVIAAPVPHPVTVTAKIPATPLATAENPTPKAAPVTIVATAVPDFEVIPSKEQPT